MVQVDFVVCHNLVVPVILCCDFCGPFFEATRPRAKPLEMENGSTIPNVRKRLKRAAQNRVPTQAAQEMQSMYPISTKLHTA